MILEISPGTFYSHGDERRLFQSLGEIFAIREVRGVGCTLLLDVDEELINNEEMRELMGLLFRYGIPLTPLRIFSKMEKFTWLDDPVKFWHKSMFQDSLK